MPNFTLKTASGSNVITTDPKRPKRRLYHLEGTHQCLSGRRVQDIFGIHYDFELEWDEMTAAQYEALRELYYSGEKLYLDDGNVPPLVEEETLATATETYTFSGISSPSATHKAYRNESSVLPTAKDDLETTEYSSLQYGYIAGDNAITEAKSAIKGEYYWHKYSLISNIAKADVRKFRVKIRAVSDDRSPVNRDGIVVSAWDGSRWVELGSHNDRYTTGVDPESYVNYSTTDKETARQFVDEDDDYIRVLVRSRGLVESNGYGFTSVSERHATGTNFGNLIVFSSELYVVHNTTGGLFEWDGTPSSDSITQVSQYWPGQTEHGAVAVYNSKLYTAISAFVDNKGKLMEWNGTDELVEVAAMHGDEDYIYSLCVHDDGGGDALYASTRPNGKLLKWNDSNAWTEIAGQFESDTRVYGLCVFNSRLYGVGYPSGKLIRLNVAGNAWEEVAAKYGSETKMLEMVVYDDGSGDKLYAITNRSTTGGLLLRLNAAGNAWELMASQYKGMDELECMVEYDGYIYAGGRDDNVNGLLRWDKTSAWEEASPLDDNATPWALAVFDSKLYGGFSTLGEYSDSFLYSLSADYRYVEVELNEDLTTLVHTLKHAPILEGGDIISVKNLTTVQTLVLDTDYTISGSTVTVTGQNPGDVIEFEYNHYHEMIFNNIPEEWIKGDPGSARHRGVVVRLSTVTQGPKDS